MFYPGPWDSDDGTLTERSLLEARRICARCPVQRACLEDAFRSPHSLRYGVRAGTSGGQRRAAAGRADRVDHLLAWFADWANRQRYYQRPEPQQQMSLSELLEAIQPGYSEGWL